MLIVTALDHVSHEKDKLFPKLRAAMEISELDDLNAKELFIALEECIRYGETGMDELLARISLPELKKTIIERSASGEFFINSEQLVSDGIKKIKEKRLERKQEEIIIKLRSFKKNSKKNSEEQNTNEKELLTEKMQIDDELNKLRRGR
jgi:DNA primase